MSIIGENIMNRRKELEMTQEELALKMGYKSKSSINKIELGISDIPQSKIIKFAEILKTTPGVLMGWEQVQKKNDAMSDIVIRMRTDSNFFSLVEKLNNLDEKQILGVSQMLSTFIK